MSDLISRIVAMSLIEDKADKDRMVRLCDIRDALNDAPTVDVVSVIRCKNCRFVNDIKLTNGEIRYICLSHHYATRIPVAENDYCSFGAKMENIEGDREE